MRSRRLTGVSPTRVLQFFDFKFGWNSGGLRVWLAWDDLFVAHRRIGSFHFGRDHCRMEGWVLSVGLCPRPDARDCEIGWRWWFRLPLNLPHLTWVQDTPSDWVTYPSCLWTGREFRLYRVRWFGREWLVS